MKAISVWGRSHIMASRMIIIICRILTFVLAWYVGIELTSINFLINPKFFWIFASLFIIVYSIPSGMYSSLSFLKRKAIDGSIILLGFLITVSFANQRGTELFIWENSLSGTFVNITDKDVKNEDKISTKNLRKQWKELRKRAKQGEDSAVGVILAVLLATTLSILLLGLACRVACNGQDALAIFVLVGGLGAIFFISKWILRITRRRDKLEDHSGSHG